MIVYKTIRNSFERTYPETIQDLRGARGEVLTLNAVCNPSFHDESTARLACFAKSPGASKTAKRESTEFPVLQPVQQAMIVVKIPDGDHDWTQAHTGVAEFHLHRGIDSKLLPQERLVMFKACLCGR